MLTRVLFALALICGPPAAASAEETKVLALGLADHEVTQQELETGQRRRLRPISTPRAVAYVLAGEPQERRYGRDHPVER